VTGATDPAGSADCACCPATNTAVARNINIRTRGFFINYLIRQGLRNRGAHLQPMGIRNAIVPLPASQNTRELADAGPGTLLRSVKHAKNSTSARQQSPAESLEHRTTFVTSSGNAGGAKPGGSCLVTPLA